MSSDYSDHNPYDFIMNPAAPPPKRPLKIPATNTKNGFLIKIGLIVGAAIVLIIGVMIASSLFTTDTSGVTTMTTLAQTQNEVIRVAAQGAAAGRDQKVKNFAVNTNLSVSTQQLRTLNYLVSKGTKLGVKQLSLKESKTTTDQLAQAKATSTFDAAFLQIMQTSLDSYSSDLQKAYQDAPNSTIKKLLKSDYEQTQLLRAQLPTTTSSSVSSTVTQ